MIIALCGRHRLRGMNVMENHIRRVFVIDGLSGIVRDFCKKFLLCLHVKGGLVIPRPFSETHYTFERNSTLHWDFLTLGDSFGTSRYMLVMKDEATHLVDLEACDRGGCCRHTRLRLGITLQNNVIAELNRRLKGRQEFVLAYSPWKNGSVERVNGDILQVLKALALEFKVSVHVWSCLLPLVIKSVIHSPVASLANRAPIELFTGLPCPSTLDTLFFPGGKGRVATLEQLKQSTEQRLATLRESIK
ncbi:Hypothetical protein PHPALM_5163 [Phytophthora palmivora]|uniref:Integrase catalytic domain-containing protein n=1 Tax=Phytophthora palmivora TaxID=4796 RepID=A0A2P4YI51_9STRA|nr:Hypothetical protein PHPALM_5163 [Phytophthora palmivora]